MVTSTQWQLVHEAAERYERILVPAILGPFAQALMAWSDLQPGERVVDIGCGTGAAARFAAAEVGPSGWVAGVDINAGMLEVAKSLPATQGAAIEWHESSAYDLSFSEGSVDVALCAQALQFFNDPPLALAEMRRILKPGGRVTLSLWSEAQENPYFNVLVTVISHHIGSDTAAGLKAIFSLSDPNKIRSLLDQAGFDGVEITVTRLDLNLPPIEEFAPKHISATPMAAGFNTAPSVKQQAVITDLKTALAQFEHKDGIRVPFSSYLARGYKKTREV